MSRRPLVVLLSLGVIFGYGGAIASAARHHRQHGCEARWNEAAAVTPAPALAPAQPQTIVVQSPVPAAAPAPQIFVIMPGATAPQAVVATPAPSPAPVAQ